MIKIKRWATICLAVILAFAAIPLPVSANDSVGILTVFSSTSGSSSDFKNPGHSWLSFVNTSSAEIKVGIYSVKPMEELTIGKWRAGEKKNAPCESWAAVFFRAFGGGNPVGAGAPNYHQKVKGAGKKK